MKLHQHACKSVAVTLASCAMALLSGCAINMKVPIKDPVVSTTSYEKGVSLESKILAFKDVQSDADKKGFLTGIIPMQLVYQDKPFDAVPWLAQQTVREMIARGLPVRQAAAGESGTDVMIRRVHIENHRVSAFSPFITFTSLRADVQTPKGLQRVTAYVKRGKVPVWSFDEIIDPTYNAPLDLVVKEFAAKLNQQLYGQIVGDVKVKELIAKIKQDGAVKDDSYLDVYQLGFSNNPIAIPELVKLLTSSNEYVRLAAISSLGILKAVDQLPVLTALYENRANIWQDRAMALKAIGDMGTPQARVYLDKQGERFADGKDKEAIWTREIIGMYK